MDFSWSVLADPIMGAGLASAIIPRRDCFGGRIVSNGQVRLRTNRWFDCVRCIWITSAKSTFGDTRPHRHATGIGDFSDWITHLAKNSQTRRMEIPRSSVLIRTAYSCDADQGSDRLRVLASWHCAFPMALCQNATSEHIVLRRLAWLVAMDCFTGRLLVMGDWRHMVSARLF